MEEKKVFYSVGLVLFSVFLLSYSWEFGVEDLMPANMVGTGRKESQEERWEYVITTTTFTTISLIIPFLWLLRASRKEKLMTGALGSSEQKFRKLVEGSIEGILVLRNFEILFSNESFAKMAGFGTSADIRGRDFLEGLVHPEDKEATKRLFLVEKGGELGERSLECKILSKDGRIIYLEMLIIMVIWEGIPAVQVTAMEVTDRKKAVDEILKARDEAGKATKLKDKFVSMAAHDMRSPISTAIGLLDYATSEIENEKIGDSGRMALERAKEKLNNQLDLLDNVLTISRIQAGSIRPQKRICSVYEVIIGALGLQDLAISKGITLVNSLPEDLKLFVDPILINQVFQNLVSNAIKFCSRGGRIELFLKGGEGGPLAVRDDGIGIQENLQAELFNHQVKTTTRGTSGELGTGFGLPLCHDIVAAHGGTVEFETAEGKGTTFTVNLPEFKPVVLVVGAMSERRRIVKNITLEKLEFVEVENIYEAMETAGDLAPALIILDLDMVDQGNFDLIQTIKTKIVPASPLVGIFSETKLRLRDRAISMGVDHIIEKPVSGTILNDLISQYLQ